MTRFNQIGVRPIRLELSVPGFDLNRATKNYQASAVARKKKRADQQTPPSAPSTPQSPQSEPDEGQDEEAGGVIVFGNQKKNNKSEPFSL